MTDLTVITAAWRKEGVENVISGLKNQTCQNFEHIIVNDCSPHITHEDLVGWCKDNPRRYFIDSGIRGGFYGSAARNVGAEMSFIYFREGDRVRSDHKHFLMFWDDDNEFYPEAIADFYDAFAANQNAVLIGAEFWEIFGTKDKDYRHKMKNKILGQQCDLGGFFYRRDIFKKCGGFDPFYGGEVHKIVYDFELLKRMVEKGGKDNVVIIPGKTHLKFFHKER
jgi:glycosyltransferase involved in cell wall biosynthesis